MGLQSGETPPQRADLDPSREREIKILETVQSIVSSGSLGAGERMPALLGYLVREELAGRGDRIKSFSIATDVLGRGQGFDPQSDSIARAEMTRLRKAVEHHNLTAGANDLVRITIPKGSYRPLIVVGETIQVPTSVEASTTPKAVRSGLQFALLTLIAVLAAIAFGAVALVGGLRLPGGSPRPVSTQPPLVVMQPQTIQSGNRLSVLADALQGEVAAELARQPWLTVVQPENLAQIEPQLTRAAATRAVYVVETRLAESGGGYTVATFLKRWPDQAIRWSGSHDSASLAQQGGYLLHNIATVIARDLAVPGGAISLAEVARMDGDATHERRFVCLMSIRRYWRSYDPALRDQAEACLQQTLAKDTDFHSGKGALALLRIESARQARGADRDKLLAEATSLLTNASSTNVVAETARMALAACLQDAKSVRDVARRLLVAYPNNPDVLADVGSKLGLAVGDWSRALELEARALSLHPLADPWYPLSTAVKAMLDGDLQLALDHMSTAPQRGFRTGHIIRLALGGASGDASLIADASARLAKLGIADRQAAREAVDGECWSDDVKYAFKRGIDATMR